MSEGVQHVRIGSEAVDADVPEDFRCPSMSRRAPSQPIGARLSVHAAVVLPGLVPRVDRARVAASRPEELTGSHPCRLSISNQ
jgi:hypothetical protein